jgi:hypothetical protein
VYKCDLCGYETESKGSFAGHRSGHVRRGELEKTRIKEKLESYDCHLCDKKFSKSVSLNLHLNAHNRPFDQLGIVAKKQRLFWELGHQCEVCKLIEWMGKPIPLELDHLDGNPTNNVRENLRLICPNCHAQTETYRGKNIGRPKCESRDKRWPKYRSEEYLKDHLGS